MKNERPLAGGEEAHVSIGPDAFASSTPIEQRARLRFDEKKHLHALAQSALDACVAREDDDTEAYEEELAKLASDHAEALDELMLLPAPTLAGLRLKLRIFSRHNLASGWWRGEEIAAILACDADRLLPWSDPA